jgi:acyl dehydratase
VVAARWTITDRERERFAAYSGDHNPIHTDPVAARRLMGGRMLVHGAHLVLAVLGQAAERITAAPEHVDVTFRRGVRPGAVLTTTFRHDSRQLGATVSAEGVRALDIAVGDGRRSPVGGALGPTDVPTDAGLPVHHTLDTLDGAAGELALTGDESIARELFPDAVELLGSQRVAELASLSRVVGMHAPGLYSMSSRYEIRLIDPKPRAPATVTFVVREVDPRMRRVIVDVKGRAQHARVTAFALPEPIEQRQLVDVRRVRSDEFAGWNVLVVGGSRGLGAAAVRLLVAGGADVRFTYHVGSEDAQALSLDTNAGAIAFDALAGEPLPRLGEWSPTHLAWFAAPAADDDAALAIQVDAFAAAADALPSPPLRAVLWPSCVRLGSLQLAGEQRCADLAERMPGVVVRAPRLPVLATDRTLALLPTEYADTTTAMLDALRALNG